MASPKKAKGKAGASPATPKKRKGDADARLGKGKRARGETDDLTRLWRTEAGDDSLPFMQLKPVFSFSNLPGVKPGPTRTASSPTLAQPSLLSGSLLGLGATTNLSALNTPFFGMAPQPAAGALMGMEPLTRF